MRRHTFLLAIVTSLVAAPNARADSPVTRLDIVAANYGGGFTVPADGQVVVVTPPGGPFDGILVVNDRLNHYAISYRFNITSATPFRIVALAENHRTGNLDIIVFLLDENGIITQVSAGGVIFFVTPAGP